MYVNGLWVIRKTFRVEALIIKCTLFISFWSVWLKSKKLPKKLVCLDEGCMNYLDYPKTLGTFRDIKQHWEWLSNQLVPCLWFRLSYRQWYRYFSCWPSISNPKQKKTILRCLIITGITYWSGDSCRGHQGFNYSWDDWSPWSIDHRMISES